MIMKHPVPSACSCDWFPISEHACVPPENSEEELIRQIHDARFFCIRGFPGSNQFSQPPFFSHILGFFQKKSS